MQPTTYKAKAYSAASETSPLASTTIARRDPIEREMQSKDTGIVAGTDWQALNRN